MRSKWTARLITGLAAFLSSFLAAAAPPGPSAPISFVEAERYATLPDDVRFPEGLAANPATGELFVATFDFGPVTNKLVRLDRRGRVAAKKDFGAAPLLGLQYRGGKVYIMNFGAGSVQRIDAGFDAGTAVETVATLPVIGSSGSRTEANPDGSVDTVTFGSSGKQAPNAMVFDHMGNLYVSDSFQGAIFEVPNAAGCAPACTVNTISHDPLLATAGTPPFGANGLALSADEKTLFIANTGDHRVLKMDLTQPTYPIAVFSFSVPGADGLLMAGGRLWVAANQADQVMGLDANGMIVIKAGEYLGVRDGAPRGMLFPASLAALDGWMYVTNLALPLDAVPGNEPEELVQHWTVSRFRIPH
jgi:sugar lactone lactonase YvrE